MPYVADRRRIDRFRLRPHPVRGARADARGNLRPLLARRPLLHRGAPGRARSATTSATPRSTCSRAAGSIVDDIERVAGGSSFFWRGRYEYDLNVAHTEDTQLGVFGEFEPKLSDASKAADVLFLANIQPDLQRQVRAQCADARFYALDSMNLWIDTARDSLLAAIAEVDCVIVNDAEIRQLTGESNLARAARAVMAMGPRAVVAKQGEYGAALFTENGFFALPGFPLEDVRDPTGAGDSFAGGFLGYIDSHEGEIDDACLRRAMGYGTVLASFNVEEFGTERVARLTREEIDERFELLREMTNFDVLPASAK